MHATLTADLKELARALSLGSLAGRATVSADLTGRGPTPAIEGRAAIADLVAEGHVVEPVETTFRFEPSHGPDSRWEGTVQSPRVRWDEIVVESITASLAVDGQRLQVTRARARAAAVPIEATGAWEWAGSGRGHAELGPVSLPAITGIPPALRLTGTGRATVDASVDRGVVSATGVSRLDQVSRGRRVARRGAGRGARARNGARRRAVVPGASAAGHDQWTARDRRRPRCDARARGAPDPAATPRARRGGGRSNRRARVEPGRGVDPARPARERTRRAPRDAKRPAGARRALDEPGPDRAALGGTARGRGALPARRSVGSPRRDRRAGRSGAPRALGRAHQRAAARGARRNRPRRGPRGGAPRWRERRAQPARRAVAGADRGRLGPRTGRRRRRAHRASRERPGPTRARVGSHRPRRARHARRRRARPHRCARGHRLTARAADRAARRDSERCGRSTAIEPIELAHRERPGPAGDEPPLGRRERDVAFVRTADLRRAGRADAASRRAPRSGRRASKTSRRSCHRPSRDAAPWP